jgi:hypothetical protein
MFFPGRHKSLVALLRPVQSFLLKHKKKRMEPIQTKQRGKYVYVKCSFVYYLFIYN